LPRNIAYHTDAIASYFGANRRQWNQFYPSERWIIERVAEKRKSFGRILDVGCACGGLAAALGGRYEVEHFTGIDINRQAIQVAAASQDISVPVTFIHGDVAEETSLEGTVFDTVFNLSCADWNVDFAGILRKSWSYVAPGGVMIISLRLTDGLGERDFLRSYQYIHYGDAAAIPPDAEKAAYVVLNVSEALAEISQLDPEHVTGYGYWGSPSATARTDFGRLVFSVFAVQKGLGEKSPAQPVLELRLPGDVWNRGGGNIPSTECTGFMRKTS
jgi:SAM-dependent methyltransferase